jgi:hypothetical protein
MMITIMMMVMSVEQSVDWELAGENEVPEENQSECRFSRHKSHMT